VQLRLGLLAASVVVPFVITHLIFSDAEQAWPLHAL
jgi:hypothetical protein